MCLSWRSIANCDFVELQQEQPQLYDSLTSNLTPDEKTIVQSVVHQADAIASRTAAEAAAAEANGGAS